MWGCEIVLECWLLVCDLGVGDDGCIVYCVWLVDGDGGRCVREERGCERTRQQLSPSPVMPGGMNRFRSWQRLLRLTAQSGSKKKARHECNVIEHGIELFPRRSHATRRQPPQAASLSYTLDCRGRTGWQHLSRSRSESPFNVSRFANSMSSSARDARLNPTLAVCAQTISVRPCCPGSLAASATRRPRFGLPHALSKASVARVSHARVEGGLASRPSCPRTPAPGPPTPPGAALARRAASPPAFQPQAEPRAALRARGFRVL